MRGSRKNTNPTATVTNGRNSQKRVKKGPDHNNDNSNRQGDSCNVKSVKGSDTISSVEIDDSNENSVQYHPEKGELDSDEKDSAVDKDTEQKGILLSVIGYTMCCRINIYILLGICVCKQ